MSTTISPRELETLREKGQPIELIDVRTPAEFREIHVPFARSVPLDRLDPAQFLRERSRPGEPLYVICKSGSRGKQACDKFMSAGMLNVVNVEGGTTAWDAAGLPVARGQKTIALERQVRIVAGALILTGAGLGYFVSSYWIGLSAFVGAGLMFSGITDTCGMGLVLAKLPWNQVGEEGSSTSRCAE